MKFHLTFFPPLLIGLLLLSGQVFAVAYYSIPGGAGLWSDPATWSGSACGTPPLIAGPTAAPLATDTLTICDSSAIPGFLIAVDAVSVGASATVKTGGILDLSSNVLTLSGALTNDGGTILSGVQAFVAQSIIHNSGTTNLTGVTTNTTNFITVNGAGLMLSPTLIGIKGLFISNTDFSMPTTVLSLTGNVVVTSGTLTLTSANAVTGNVTINDGAFVIGQTGGTTSQLPAATPLPLPTPPMICSIGYFLTISSTHTFICVLLPLPNTVSAPLFSIKEKARMFTEEII